MLEPDRDQLEIFVEAGGLPVLIDVAEDDARRAANCPKPVVFCPPLATFRSTNGATEKDIAEGLALSVECDADPQTARARLEQILGPATAIIRSGGIWADPQTGEQADKLHLHWRLAEPATGKELTLLKQARAAATRLAGGDPSNVPVVHPIRWPGSWHRKAEPRLCTIETADPDHEIVLELALDALETAAPAPRGADNARGDNGREHRRIEWEDAFRQILTGNSYHPTLAPLAASLAGWGAPGPVTENVLRALLINSTPQDPERARRRDAELAKLPQTVASAYTKFGKADDNSEPKQERLRWHGDDDRASARAWLVNSLLPETGIGLISGQWGTYKTFVSLDLAAAVMVGLAFIDYPIARNGGVLFIAVEGASEIAARLQAVLKTKYPDRVGMLPFAWIDDCPRLLGTGAVKALAALAREAADRMQKDFGVALALVAGTTW